MSRLTRDGTAEPVSRDQTLRHVRGQGNIHFPCSADHEQDWQPYPVDHTLLYVIDHPYIHTYIQYINTTYKVKRRRFQVIQRPYHKSSFATWSFKVVGPLPAQKGTSARGCARTAGSELNSSPTNGLLVDLAGAFHLAER